MVVITDCIVIRTIRDTKEPDANEYERRQRQMCIRDCYYEPVDSGLEIRIREKLARLKGKLGAGAT